MPPYLPVSLLVLALASHPPVSLLVLALASPITRFTVGLEGALSSPYPFHCWARRGALRPLRTLRIGRKEAKKQASRDPKNVKKRG